jgi:glycosyltransferase involved in cell wall biosynthesis
MKAILFTPVGIKSAIGKVSASVSIELRRQGIDVLVVASELNHDVTEAHHLFSAPIVSWRETQTVLEALDSSDLNVHHIGDNYLFHGGGLPWLSSAGGILCLHDFYVGNLFSGWATLQDKTPEAFEIVEDCYGTTVANDFFSFGNSKDFIDFTSRSAPMTEWLCSKADAVISHSSWGMGRVLEACAGPVREVPLPYSTVGVFFAAPNTSSPSQPGKITLLTVGHINANKRAEVVIRSIGGDPRLRSLVDYRLVGPIEESVQQELTTLAGNLGVSLEICGEVSDSRLAAEFQRSDLVACLRWPVLEAASASTIEAMLSGKPVMVNDQGFYATIPDALTMRVSLDNEEDDIRSALRSAVNNPGTLRVLGASGRVWAQETFSVENYVQQLLEVSEELRILRPIKSALDSYAKIIKELGGPPDILGQGGSLEPLGIFQ